MRYSIPDPVEWEGEDATPPLVPVDADGLVEAAPTTADAPPVGPPPGIAVAEDDAGDEGEPEPPLWRTSDDQVLHLPRRRARRILRRLPRLWSRPWSRFAPGALAPRFSAGAFGPQFAPGAFGRRSSPGAFGRRFAPPGSARRRPAAIGALGRMVRNARRAGTLRSRTTGSRLPVFRSQVRGKPVRIITRRRHGMRHEILSVEPELMAFEQELDPKAVQAAVSALEPAIARLAKEWSDKHGGNPSVEAAARWLRRDLEETLTGADGRAAMLGSAPHPIDEVGRAWLVGRSEHLRFKTDMPAKLKSLGAFAAPTGASLVSDRLISGSDKAPVAPLLVQFVKELRKRNRSFSVWNYAGHGGTGFSGRGFSLDFSIPGRDARGFFPPAKAIDFLRALGKTADAVGAKWHVLYNDFTVADAINRETGVRHVGFQGGVRRKGSRITNLNWHGPRPLILHFHLDLAPKA